MRLYISQYALGCPHMAGLSWLTPSTLYWEFHFYSVSQKAFRLRQRYSCRPAVDINNNLSWQWFTAHALKLYIAPDAAVKLYKSRDIDDEICHAQQVNRSDYGENASFWCFAVHSDWQYTQNKTIHLRLMLNTMLQMSVYSLQLELAGQ